MNWYKRANLYEQQQYDSDIEREYVQLNESFQRMYRQYKTNNDPTALEQLRVLKRRLDQLRMSLQLLNKQTNGERLSRLEKLRLRRDPMGIENEPANSIPVGA